MIITVLLSVLLFASPLYSITKINAETSFFMQNRDEKQLVQSVYTVNFRDMQFTYNGIIVVFINGKIRVKIMQLYAGNYYDQIDEEGTLFKDDYGYFHFKCTDAGSWELRNYIPDHFIFNPQNGQMYNYGTPNSQPLPVVYGVVPPDSWSEKFKVWGLK